MAIFNKELIDKYKNKLLNITVIILSLAIANNIYKKESQITAALEERGNIESKKNIELTDISLLEKKINAYKNMFYNKEQSMIITTISGIAKDTNVRILSVKPQNEKRFDVYTKYFLGLSIVAKDYHTLGNFLSAIESFSDFYMVEKINIKSNTASDNTAVQGQIGAEIILSTLSFQ